MARTMKVDLPALHPRRRDDAAGPAVAASPRPLRDHPAAGLLRRRRARRGSWTAPPRSCRSGSTPEAAREIGSRSRGTPRIANRLLRRLRDFAEVAGKDAIDLETARQALVPPGGRRARLRRAGPADPLDDHREVRRRPRRRRRDRGLARRGPRHARGPLRALPAPGRLPAADSAGPHRLARGVPAPGHRRAAARGRAVLKPPARRSSAACSSTTRPPGSATVASR